MSAQAEISAIEQLMTAEMAISAPRDDSLIQRREKSNKLRSRWLVAIAGAHRRRHIYVIRKPADGIDDH